MSYKLSFTAQEIDSKLSKVQDGGCGYTEGETIQHIDQKYLPNSVVAVNTTASVGQTIVVKAVDENGKPTEWETANLPDSQDALKELGVEMNTEFTNLLPDVMGDSITVTFEDGQTVITDLTMFPESTYRIVWDGVPYDCKSFIHEQEGQFGLIVGNASMFGYSDTGEPFLIVCVDGIICAALTDFGKGETTTHTIGFYKLTKTIDSPIDTEFLPDTVITTENVVDNLPSTIVTSYNIDDYFPKDIITRDDVYDDGIIITDQCIAEHLPGVCLPYVDITSVQYSDDDEELGIALGYEESEALTAAAHACLPCVINFALGGINYSAFASLVDDNGFMYVTSVKMPPREDAFVAFTRDVEADSDWYMVTYRPRSEESVPVVNITSSEYPSGDSAEHVYLDDKESKALTAAARAGSPCVIKFSVIDDAQYSAFATLVNLSSVFLLAALASEPSTIFATPDRAA